MLCEFLVKSLINYKMKASGLQHQASVMPLLSLSDFKGIRYFLFHKELNRHLRFLTFVVSIILHITNRQPEVFCVFQLLDKLKRIYKSLNQLRFIIYIVAKNPPPGHASYNRLLMMVVA